MSLSRDPNSPWKPDYRFADVVLPMACFARMCRFHQTSPQSLLTQKRVCSLDGARVVTPIANGAEVARLLERHVGIVAPREPGA